MASCNLRASACAGLRASISGITEVSPSAGSNSANGGNVGKSVPPGSMPKASRSSSSWPIKCRCLYSTPLGTPVLPLVNKMAARSSAPGVGNSSSSEQRKSRRRRLPNQPWPVVRCTFADGAQPNTRRARCAIGKPIKPCGSASRRHCLSEARGIPGSISTGTMPARNSANMLTKKSNVGFSMTTIRSPRSNGVLCSKPRASAVLRFCSSPNVSNSS